MSAKTKATESEPKTKAKAKVREPAPVIPILTKPEGKSSGDLDKLPVTGFENQAAAIRRLAQQIESDESEKNSLARDLVNACRIKRLNAEKVGSFHKTCEVASADQAPVLVIFADKYSKVDVKHADVLKTAFGDAYKTLVRRGVDLKVNSEVTLSQLKTALGDHYEAFLALVEPTEFLTLQKGFMEKRAALRPALDAETNEIIDGIAAQVQSNPSVKTK